MSGLIIRMLDFFEIILISIPIISLCPFKIKIREYLLLIILTSFPYLLVIININGRIGGLIIFICLSLFIYKKSGNKFMGICIAFFSLLVGIMADIAVGSVFVFLTGDIVAYFNSRQYNAIIYECFVTLFSFILSKPLGYILNTKLRVNYNKQSKFANLLIVLMLTVNVLFFYIMLIFGINFGMKLEVLKILGVVFPLYLIITTIVILYLFNIIEKEVKIEAHNSMLSNLQLYTESIEKLYTSMKGFRHEYINILATLSIFIAEKKYDELDIYFNTKILPISNKINNDNFKLGLLGNVKILELKGIIAFKTIMAQESNINFTIDIVDEVSSINIDIIDLCNIVGILLDNAIEESELCDFPCISFCIVVKNRSKIIIINNKCSNDIPSIDDMYQSGFSTKGKDRGIGLPTAKAIIDSCDNCFLETKVNNNEFTISIDIYD